MAKGEGKKAKKSKEHKKDPKESRSSSWGSIKGCTMKDKKGLVLYKKNVYIVTDKMTIKKI